MAITAADLKFFDSERMTDDANAGGRRGANALLTGDDNNVWPPVDEDASLLGARHLRKIYPSVVAESADALRSATTLVDSVPDDAKLHVALVQNGDQNTVRFEVAALVPTNIETWVAYNGSNTPRVSNATIDGGSTTLTIAADVARAQLDLGYSGSGATLLVLEHAGGKHYTPVVETEVGIGGSEQERDVEIAVPFPGATVGVAVTVKRLYAAATPRIYGCCSLLGEQASGASTLLLQMPVIRLSGSAWAKAFAEGDVCTIWHEAETTPATQANSDVINAGRTDLAQLALVDDDDNEIARAYANGPAVSGVGATFDLAAGTVTCTDVSGWAQPVRLRHRIEQRVALDAVDLEYNFSGNGTGTLFGGGSDSTYDPPTVTLAAPLARTFPAGSYLSSEVPHGTLQGTVPLQFSQQAWTRVWSDSVIGAAVGALYVGDIALTAEGAESDRWACVFTSATQYTLHSERWGVVGTGNVGSDYVPLSPATNQPLMTLAAAGWVLGGIALGNVLRFNTVGAYAPAWANRYAEPGATEGPGSVRLRLRGSVDA